LRSSTDRKMTVELHPHPNLPPEGEGDYSRSSTDRNHALPLRGRARVGVVLSDRVHFVMPIQNR